MRVRSFVLALLIASCKKDAAAPPAPPQPTGVVAASDAAAVADATPLVELLHAVASTVRVSSRVANAQIQPAHLVDGDRSTAWNSRTGDLVGSWIDVDVGTAAIRELRLTVGHTGKGEHGEDYFTMNPRIRRVAILRDGRVIAKATLDVERRDLQAIALPAPASHVRLRVDEIVAGTKRTWRETCVSELEAWGELPAGAKAVKQKPTVDVGEPLPDGSTDAISDEQAFCKHALADLVLAWGERQRASDAASKQCAAGQMEMCEMGDATPTERPTCEFQPEHKYKLAEPWRAVGLLRITHDSFEGASCQLAVQTAAGWWLAGDPLDCGEFTIHDRMRSVTITQASTRGGKLEVLYSFDSPGFETTEPATNIDYRVTCTAGARVDCAPAEVVAEPTP